MDTAGNGRRAGGLGWHLSRDTRNSYPRGSGGVSRQTGELHGNSVGLSDATGGRAIERSIARRFGLSYVATGGGDRVGTVCEIQSAAGQRRYSWSRALGPVRAGCFPGEL